MAKDKVRARVDALVRQRERGILAAAMSDRERVLDKLRHFMDHANLATGVHSVSRKTTEPNPSRDGDGV